MCMAKQNIIANVAEHFGVKRGFNAMENLSDKYLLMIEPDLKGKASLLPLLDDITRKTIYLYSLTKPSEDSYRGFHATQDGQISDNKDHIFPNGIITHSLCVHYIKYYRPYVPQSEIDKINRLYTELNRNERE